MLKRIRAKVSTFGWNLTEPLEALFSLIYDLNSVSEEAPLPKTDPQLITYSIDIIRLIGEFETALISFNTRLVTENTWDNFKSHFSTIHQNLYKDCVRSIHSTVFYLTSTTPSTLAVQMDTFCRNLVASINSLSLGQISTSRSRLRQRNNFRHRSELAISTYS